MLHHGAGRSVRFAAYCLAVQRRYASSSSSSSRTKTANPSVLPDDASTRVRKSPRDANTAIPTIDASSVKLNESSSSTSHEVEVMAAQLKQHQEAIVQLTRRTQQLNLQLQDMRRTMSSLEASVETQSSRTLRLHNSVTKLTEASDSWTESSQKVIPWLSETALRVDRLQNSVEISRLQNMSQGSASTMPTQATGGQRRSGERPELADGSSTSMEAIAKRLDQLSEAVARMQQAPPPAGTSTSMTADATTGAVPMPNVSRRVLVSNIPSTLNAAAIRTMFQPAGVIRSVLVTTTAAGQQAASNRDHRSMVVTFASADEAKRAIERFHGHKPNTGERSSHDGITDTGLVVVSYAM